MSESNDELSLKQLILNIKDWGQSLLSKWMLLLFIGVLGSGLGLIYSLIRKPTYTGSLTFVLSNESKVNGGIASIAGQFGLDVSGSGSSGAFDGENIIELLKSRRIIKGALFKKLPDNKTTLINIIGEEFGFYNGWRKNERLNKQIPFLNDEGNLTPVQDSLVGVIHAVLIKYSLSIGKPDKKLSFYQVSTTSVNETVSTFLTKYIVDEAAKMYIETKTKTARENLAMLQHEADSLRQRLGGTIYATSSKIDETFNLNPALQTLRAPIQQNQVQAQVLGTAYGEVIKNLEIAKITVQKETPLYQIIDEPLSPLVKVKFGKLKGLILGGIIAVLLGCAILITLRILNKIMS